MGCNCVKNNQYEILLKSLTKDEGLYYRPILKEWYKRTIAKINKDATICCYYNYKGEKIVNEVKTTRKSSDSDTDNI